MAIIQNSFPRTSGSNIPNLVRNQFTQLSSNGLDPTTRLTPEEESRFQTWATYNKIQAPPPNVASGLDMRGYWKANFSIKTSYRWDE